jgi:plasmid stabilization system protein ParE
MNKLSISPEAKRDLENIKAYISNELENPVAALNVVSRITKSLKNPKDMPGIGPRLSSRIPFLIPHSQSISPGSQIFHYSLFIA